MSNREIRRLKDWEKEVYLWVEQESSIMVKASSTGVGDPVELTAHDARELAAMLMKAADDLDACL